MATTVTHTTSDRQRHLQLGLDPRDLVHLEVHPEVLEFGTYRTHPTMMDGLSID